jgi:hypothetical protein
MTNHKGDEMNVWKTIALVAAVLALAAPAANAKFDSSSPSKPLHAKVTHHKKVAPNVKTKTTPRVLIIVTQYAPAPQDPSADDCAMSGNNCTDQQLCELWGMNCDLAAAAATNVAANEEQTASS